MASLRIGDREGLTKYYELALENFQQLNCRQISKAFIQFIAPRKQTTHPYSGNIRGSAIGSTGDPEKSKPTWWPPGVMHKEPDHLLTEGNLLLPIPAAFHINSFL